MRNSPCLPVVCVVAASTRHRDMSIAPLIQYPVNGAVRRVLPPYLFQPIPNHRLAHLTPSNPTPVGILCAFRPIPRRFQNPCPIDRPRVLHRKFEPICLYPACPRGIPEQGSSLGCTRKGPEPAGSSSPALRTQGPAAPCSRSWQGT